MANFISTNDTIQFINEKYNMKITLVTLINWIKSQNLGRKIGGRWQVDKDLLIQYLESNNGTEKKEDS